jgi:hypothetical protein
MTSKARNKIIGALHSAQHEIALEANKTARIKALIREYLSEQWQQNPAKNKKRREQIEAELHKYSTS